jgi:hypothetical protein
MMPDVRQTCIDAISFDREILPPPENFRKRRRRHFHRCSARRHHDHITGDDDYMLPRYRYARRLAAIPAATIFAEAAPVPGYVIGYFELQIHAIIYFTPHQP